MLLEEIKDASSIAILAEKDGAECQFDVHAAEITDSDAVFIKNGFRGSRIPSFIVLDTIKHESYIVTFDKTYANCQLTATVNEKPYRWKHIVITEIHLPDAGLKHLVFSFDDVDVFNRRQEFRVNFDTAATITLDGSATTIDVFLRDISPSGLGFRCDSSVKINVGDQLQLQFKSTINGSAQPTLFTINAKVAQVTETERKSLIVGCEMLFRRNKALQILLNERQRKQLQAGK